MKKVKRFLIVIFLILLLLLTSYTTTAAENTIIQKTKDIFQQSQKIEIYINDLLNDQEFEKYILEYKDQIEKATFKNLFMGKLFEEKGEACNKLKKSIENTIENVFQSPLNQLSAIMVSLVVSATAFVICLMLYPVVTPLATLIGFVYGFLSSISEVCITGGVLTGLIFSIYMTVAWPFAVSVNAFVFTMALIS